MQQHEVQQCEVQQREIQQREVQQREMQQHEVQQREMQQREMQQCEVQQREIQQREMQQCEVQQHEVQQREMQQREMQQCEVQQREMQQREIQQREMQQCEVQQREMQQREMQQREVQQCEVQQRDMKQYFSTRHTSSLRGHRGECSPVPRDTPGAKEPAGWQLGAAEGPAHPRGPTHVPVAFCSKQGVCWGPCSLPRGSRRRGDPAPLARSFRRGRCSTSCTLGTARSHGGSGQPHAHRARHRAAPQPALRPSAAAAAFPKDSYFFFFFFFPSSIKGWSDSIRVERREAGNNACSTGWEGKGAA
ncbi:inner centromere protein-like [Cygnus atratus]|uniref:inner centromere protein-like n=1 Tax=Cygnus atratus TaxID=8868 RepID=UPI0021B7FF66|nr:inner centromere protein-like [Cygnus atratus]